MLGYQNQNCPISNIKFRDTPHFIHLIQYKVKCELKMVSANKPLILIVPSETYMPQ